jgi:hypothetical protein
MITLETCHVTTVQFCDATNRSEQTPPIRVAIPPSVIPDVTHVDEVELSLYMQQVAAAHQTWADRVIIKQCACPGLSYRLQAYPFRTYHRLACGGHLRTSNRQPQNLGPEVSFLEHRTFSAMMARTVVLDWDSGRRYLACKVSPPMNYLACVNIPTSLHLFGSKPPGVPRTKPAKPIIRYFSALNEYSYSQSVEHVEPSRLRSYSEGPKQNGMGHVILNVRM